MSDRKIAGPRSWEEAKCMARESADAMTDEEDAAITAAANTDPDSPIWTDEMWARATPMDPERLRRLRGQHDPQKSKPVKRRVAIRLDPDVVARINEALCKLVARSKAKPTKLAKRARGKRG
jgi:uncharacterized protein (DUF4415 family)